MRSIRIRSWGMGRFACGTVYQYKKQLSGYILIVIVTVQHPVKGTLIFGQNRENKISVSSLL